MSQIIKCINDYKRRSRIPMTDNQTAYIPVINKDQIECTVEDYLVNGKRTMINISNEVCFKLRYLNFLPLEPRKYMEYTEDAIHYNWGGDAYIFHKRSLLELVEEKVLSPIMLFINGIFIPWEYITIAIGQSNYYLTVSVNEAWPDNGGRFFIDLIRNIKYAQIVKLPNHIKYESDFWPIRVDSNDPEAIMCFNENGRYVSIDSIENAHSKYSTDIYFKFYTNTSGHHMGFKRYRQEEVVLSPEEGISDKPYFISTVSENTDLKLVPECALVFVSGLLCTGEIDNIVRATDSEYRDYTNDRDFVVRYALEMKKSDEELPENPNISFDSTVMSTTDGQWETDEKVAEYIVFYNNKHRKSADNISKISVTALKDVVEESILNDTPSYLTDLRIPFELSMDRNKSYDTNIADAIKTMMSYNSSIFNDVYQDSANMKIEEHAGQWLLDIADHTGIARIPRQHSSMIDEYIIVMVNGLMYQYYYMCKYKANFYEVPVQGINPDDTIELLRFQNVNNLVYDITISSTDNDFGLYTNDIVNKDMVLYSTETEDEYFEFPSDGLQHFPVDYSLEYDSLDRVKIVLTNPFYYDKPLKLAYRNRFKHFEFRLTEDETTDKYSVDLGDKFMYCNEYSRFLVFHNGRRLSFDHFRLTLPVRSTTPFYKFDIYLSIPIQNGDKLDVIYTPSLMTDVSMMPEVPLSGDIVLDKNILNFCLSTDLYMIWINGKKIPKSHIFDIDSHHLRLVSNENSTQTLCITKYIPDIDELTSAFKENEALWDKVMDQLTTEEIGNLLGITQETLQNIETSVYENAIDIKAIMFELIREQYLMNPNVDSTSSFIYDYQDVDTTAIDGYDSENNAILPVVDANRSDNLSDVDRIYS